MALVLAIEPDIRQATILRRVVREQVRADLVLVDSRDAALAALTARIPDVILLTALLSPRDEEELLTYLRTLAGAQHVQTHTIPQLASTAADLESRTGSGGLFGKLLRKKEPDQKPIPGCDPDLFADEIRTFIERATERKSEAVDAQQQRVAHLEFQVSPSPQAVDSAAEAVASFAESTAEPAPEGGSAWASPFEWRPASRPNAAPASSSTLITSVPLAVVAEDREEQARRADAEAEAKRKREEEEERRRLDAAAKRRQEEEERRQREAEAKRKREEAEARRKREEEAERKRLEAAVQRKREEEEGKRRLEAEAKRKRDEEERNRLEAAAKRKREEAEAKRKREEEAERQRLEAQAKRRRDEEERKRREEAEAKRKREEEERQRLEAEARRQREEAEAKRRREDEERQRIEAEARRQREEAEARRRRDEEEARLRQEDEERRRREEEEEAGRREEELAAANADRFAEFRADHDEPTGVLRLMPLAMWARVESARANGDDPGATDDLQRLIAGLKIPTNVAVISYPRGCRIRRVRVRTQKQPAPAGEKRRPLIVSRRALRGPREDARS